MLDIARTIADNAPLSVAASKLTINEMLKDESRPRHGRDQARWRALLRQRRLQGRPHRVHGEAPAAVRRALRLVKLHGWGARMQRWP